MAETETIDSKVKDNHPKVLTKDAIKQCLLQTCDYSLPYGEKELDEAAEDIIKKYQSGYKFI